MAARPPSPARSLARSRAYQFVFALGMASNSFFDNVSGRCEVTMSLSSIIQLLASFLRASGRTLKIRNDKNP